MHIRYMNSISDHNYSPQANAFQNVGLTFAALLAFLSASCCVLPIGLTIVGFGGAWLAILGQLVAYREIILIIVSVFGAFLWFRIWATGDRPVRQRRGIAMVSVLSLIVGIAWTAPLWEWGVTSVLIDVWANQQ